MPKYTLFTNLHHKHVKSTCMPTVRQTYVQSFTGQHWLYVQHTALPKQFRATLGMKRDGGNLQ